jgi:hypothetical protein
MSASNSPASSDNNRSNDLLDFELSLPFKEVWRYVFARPKEGERKDDFWVKGVLDKRTGKVISATTGRTGSFNPT